MCIAGLFALVIITGVSTLVYLVPQNAHARPIWYRSSALPLARATAVDRATATCSYAQFSNTLSIRFRAPLTEAGTQIEAKGQDEAYLNRPSSMLRRGTFQSDVPATSTTGSEPPRIATVADAGAENDAALLHSRVHDDDLE